ncbi:MAG: hypothetical protein ABEJ89_04590 [Haloarculaceae archaeon]
MAPDQRTLHSARNGFLVVILALVAVAAYQFWTRGRIAPAVSAVWVLGVAVFYGSKWYYGRGEGGN